MIRIIYCILVFVSAFDVYGASSNKSFSKMELAAFAQPFIQAKINTKDFNVIIEKISGQSLGESASLEGAVVQDFIVSPQQRDFDITLKLTSGESCTFSGKIEWLAHIPVLLRPIGAGEIINVSDVGYQTYPVDQLNARFVMDANDLVGKTSSGVVVKPGLPVERSILKNPIIIKKGEVVDVVYRSQHLQVSAKARSTQDLASGDTGTFETQGENAKQTMRKISAKVVGPSTAEIIYGIA
ncbi:MAG: flagellar basal body P-ring formation chaperone FlgA [Pseudomonadota bacterium]|jgi:flagella basal body P-ring formation protein FlgA|nr:flagellar basal body P-ring formation chaperone FlgA [Alphaproteobacteria bacterium]